MRCLTQVSTGGTTPRAIPFSQMTSLAAPNTLVSTACPDDSFFDICGGPGAHARGAVSALAREVIENDAHFMSSMTEGIKKLGSRQTIALKQVVKSARRALLSPHGSEARRMVSSCS
jgi:hypothetical protein